MLTSNQKHLISFSCLILMTGLMAMDFINPSLPYIMHSLNTNEASTKLLIVFYLMGISLLQFFYGTFSDNYGRKKTILLSYVISIIGIVLSVLSHSIGMLYIARFINGLGNGGAVVIARAIISDVCDDPRSLKQAFSYFSMFAMLSPTFAPIMGGFIQQYTGNWRLCFVALLCATIFTATMVQLFMPETHSVPSVKTSLMEQGKSYLSLLRSRKFMTYNFASGAIYVFSMAYYAYMPFILFNLHFLPIENGVLFGTYAVALILGAFSLARYFNKFDSAKLFAVCCFLFLFAAMSFCLYFYFSYSMAGLVLLSVVIAFICGVSAPLTMAICMQDIPSGKKGAASAVQGFMKMFFAGIALFLFNFIPLRSVTSLLICYLILSIAIFCLCLFDRRSPYGASAATYGKVI